MQCSICGGSRFETLLDSAEIAEEVRLRSRLADSQLRGHFEKVHRMDISEFMYGDVSPIERCMRCGVAVRAHVGESNYEGDVYDESLLRMLYPRYLAAFRERAPIVGEYLDPHSDVVELGSHLGAFLEAAEEVGWRATGLDVGGITSKFARAQGGVVKRAELHELSLPGGRRDALFIWNCFEQVRDPTALLAEAHRILKRHGLLVVRVPNVAFHLMARRMAASGSQRARRALLFNNLYGFPYLHGFNRRSLEELLQRWGFSILDEKRSSLITWPLPEPDAKQSCEIERELERPLQLGPRLESPWIELIARRAV